MWLGVAANHACVLSCSLLLGSIPFPTGKKEEEEGN
jgi:hypothetical protein